VWFIIYVRSLTNKKHFSMHDNMVSDGEYENQFHWHADPLDSVYVLAGCVSLWSSESLKSRQDFCLLQFDNKSYQAQHQTEESTGYQFKLSSCKFYISIFLDIKMVGYMGTMKIRNF
jgi:hypothetical protein